MLEVYADFAENVLSVPVVKGAKTPGERFAGALGLSVEYHLVPAKKSKRRLGIVVES